MHAHPDHAFSHSTKNRSYTYVSQCWFHASSCFASCVSFQNIVLKRNYQLNRAAGFDAMNNWVVSMVCIPHYLLCCVKPFFQTLRSIEFSRNTEKHTQIIQNEKTGTEQKGLQNGPFCPHRTWTDKSRHNWPSCLLFACLDSYRSLSPLHSFLSAHSKPHYQKIDGYPLLHSPFLRPGTRRSSTDLSYFEMAATPESCANNKVLVLFVSIQKKKERTTCPDHFFSL